jgi:hypothetical protein
VDAAGWGVGGGVGLVREEGGGGGARLRCGEEGHGGVVAGGFDGEDGERSARRSVEEAGAAREGEAGWHGRCSLARWRG